MKSLAILYICTGPYKVFWKEYFETFEKHFLLDLKKDYYIFTDSEYMDYMDECERIHIIHIDNQPWPLITLLRFRYFLSIKEQLEHYDYLMFSNSNLICVSDIYEKDFLPTDNECMSFTIHPGYYCQRKYKYPYERNKKSLAYIPYNCGEYYVIGAMFAGKASAFLHMCKALDERICNDLKKGVIAKWHDESHLNRYVLGHSEFRYLNPGYCYPCGFDVPFERKIDTVSKEDKFDIGSFKGTIIENKNISLSDRIKNRIERYCAQLKISVIVLWELIVGESVDTI